MTGADIVFTGAAGDIAYVEGIRAIMKNASLNLAEKPIRTSPVLLRSRACGGVATQGQCIFFAMDTPVSVDIRPDRPVLYRAFQ